MSSTSVKYSSKGMQTVVPIGIPTFDDLIGGGFALTSLNMLEENVDHVFSAMLAKAYIATGIESNQRVIIFSSTIKNKQSRFLSELPTSQSCSSSSIDSAPQKESMNIAFRYSQLPSRFADVDEPSTTATRLDYGQFLAKTVVEKASIEFYHPCKMLGVLHDEVTNFQDNPSSSILRIFVDNFGTSQNVFPEKNMANVIYRLKILLRRLPKSVCLTTLSSDLFESLHSAQLLARIRNQVDSIVGIVAFLDEHDEQNPYRKDYVALVHLIRLPKLNSFAPYNISLESTQFGLKLTNGKRFLAVEKLALPPDLSETVNRFTCAVNIE